MAPHSDWQRWRGFLAALLVFAFAAAPGIDALICCGDGAVAGQAPAADAPACADQHESGAEPEGHGLCQHGHCHHGGVFMAAVAAPADVLHGSRHLDRPALTAGGSMDMKFGLMRPPRA